TSLTTALNTAPAPTFTYPAPALASSMALHNSPTLYCRSGLASRTSRIAPRRLPPARRVVAAVPSPPVVVCDRVRRGDRAGPGAGCVAGCVAGWVAGWVVGWVAGCAVSPGSALPVGSVWSGGTPSVAAAPVVA